MEIINLIVVLSFLLACILRDFFYFKIDNTLISGILVTGLLHQWFYYSPPMWLFTFLMMSLAFLIGWCLYYFQFTGGGDGKLLTVLMLWIPPTNLLEYLIIVALLGAALAIIEVALSRPLHTLRNKITNIPLKSGKYWHHPVPYGVALAAGGIIVILGSVGG